MDQARDHAGVSSPETAASLDPVARTHITRRRAVGIGLAAGVGSLLAPLRAAPALARPGARIRGFGLTVTPGDFGPDGTSHVLRARRGFDLVGLRGAGRAEVRVRRRGGDWSPWIALAVRGDHAPDTGSGERVRPAVVRPRRRTAGPARPRAPQAAAAAHGRDPARRAPARRRGRRAPRGRPRPGRAGAWHAAGDRPARRVGGGRRAPSQRAELRLRPARLRAPHGHRQRVRAGRLGRDRARHRQVPPRHERLELHRLQLPRRPLRPGLRGPGGGVDQAVVGAQAQGYNTVSTGVAQLGTYSAAGITPAAMQATAQLLAGSCRCTACPPRARSSSPRPAATPTVTRPASR